MSEQPSSSPSSQSSQLPLRVVAAFVCLPVAVGLERLAWFATRSAVIMRYSEVGGERAAGITSTWTGALIGAVVAGVLASALLPRIVIVAAGVAAATGYFVAAYATDSGTLGVGVAVASAGAGALKCCLYALAILLMPTPRLRVLYVVVASLVVNAASVVANIIGGFLVDELGVKAGLISGGVAILFGMMPALVVVVVDKLATASASTPAPAPSPDRSRALVGALIMAAALVPLFASMSRLHLRLTELGVGLNYFGIIFGASTLLTLAAMISFIAWYLTRRPDDLPSSSMLVGLSLATAAAGALLAAVPSLPTLALSQLCFSIAEVGAPLAMARGLANHHPRVVTLVAALLTCAPWLASAPLPDAVGLGGAFLVIAVFAGGAFALIKNGAKLDAWLDAPTTTPPESWLHGQRS